MKRNLLAAPPLVSAMAAMALVVASLAAYGAGDAVDYPGWMPTLGGLITALPIMVLSLLAFAEMRRATGEDYNANLVRAALGGSVYLLAGALMVAYVATIGNEDSYKGEFNTTTGRYDPLFTGPFFIFASVALTALICIGMELAKRQLYLPAIDHQIDEVEGLDPLGEVMKT